MFFKNIHSRMKIALLIITFVFIVIIARVFYIQVIDYKKLNKYAGNLWSRNLPIKADRGLIYDRNGVILADNVTTTSLVLIPNQIKDKEETTQKLAEILGVSYEDMYKHVSKKTSIERVHPEGRQLSYETADKIKDLKLDGVYLVKESKRSYPYDTYLAHTLGFVGVDNQGLSGIELTYDKYLTGEDGAIKYYSDAKGNRLKLNEVYEQPQDGMNITLTINNEIQSSLERELDNAVTKYDPDRAIGIVMDPNNGEILAMSARPNFSPSNYQDYSLEEINRNLPIWATYEPGSTFKIITLATALEEGKVDLDKDTYNDSGSIKVENATLHCWKHGGHGHETFLQVVENSCNPGFVVLGQRLGKNKLFEYIDKFGFGKKTGIDLNGEGTGIIFDLNKVGPVELATTAFGQGVSVTPIQQITAVSAAINGGKLYKPYIVKSINEPETNTVIQENKKTLVRQVISEKTSAEVRRALESVVANGSGRTAYIDGYRVGGKTGTAQKVENGHYLDNNYILSFIGFLPADDPQVVVYVAVDNPKGTVQYGGTTVGPIAKAVLKDSIKALNIERRDGGMDKKYKWPDPKTKEVADVVGMSVEDAKAELEGLNVIIEGDGDKVIHQSPEAGVKLDEGETVRLFVE
ncbi:MAG TPA: stage V sporulation protein D [Candidatus Coprosoma intestinipullorum]|uniref:Stage V sporulation protein D n=1 Tax=Candidatus Coprosoma intestinipullorum TaxID=2840752 RepID=A0A9D1CXS9_9FIRM|nr:stage V sporulation protein D [Candidatus Coprosoma intestinipullorum]